jgi:hypothetical protein
MFIQQHNPRTAVQPIRLPGESTFELYLRIDPVVIISGNKGRWHAFEAESAGHLMRELHRLGEEGIRIRGVLCELGVLSVRSRDALNCFLRHGPGLRLFKKGEARGAKYNRFAWYELQRYLGFRWVR